MDNTSPACMHLLHDFAVLMFATERAGSAQIGVLCQAGGITPQGLPGSPSSQLPKFRMSSYDLPDISTIITWHWRLTARERLLWLPWCSTNLAPVCRYAAVSRLWLLS